MKKTYTRREFAKISGLTTLTAAATAAISINANASGTTEMKRDVAKAAGPIMADVNKHSSAKGIGYIAKATDPKRACSGCNFYKDKKSKKPGAYAPCQLIIEEGGKVNVLAGASCNTFSAKS